MINRAHGINGYHAQAINNHARHCVSVQPRREYYADYQNCDAERAAANVRRGVEYLLAFGIVPAFIFYRFFHNKSLSEVLSSQFSVFTFHLILSHSVISFQFSVFS